MREEREKKEKAEQEAKRAKRDADVKMLGEKEGELKQNIEKSEATLKAEK